VGRIASLTHRRTLPDLGMIDSFGHVLSENTKWKRARCIASPFSLRPVLQVRIGSRTWLVFANMIVSSERNAGIVLLLWSPHQYQKQRGSLCRPDTELNACVSGAPTFRG
jgi:hypothetical protein